jgi:excisionase family DNA binding protein
MMKPGYIMGHQQYISVAEAAWRLNLTEAEVMRLIATGLLDRYRYRGLYVRVRADQVEELRPIGPQLLRLA